MSGALGANTGPLAQWAQALARGADSIFDTDVVAKLRAAGVPLGSPFGQWALNASRFVVDGAPSPDNITDLSRAIGAQYQKPPVGSGEWINEVNDLFRHFD